VQIGRVFGISVLIDWSWLLIFALLVWSLSSSLGPFGTIAASWRIPAALITVLALFACVVVHELAHALVARAYGIKTQEVLLFAFGGVSQMERVGVDAKSEALIAVAGPLTSLVLGGIFGAIRLVLPQAGDAAQVFGYLALINVVLAFFNLLPAYPMDGGRIVHALAWGATHSRTKAIQIAGTLGTIMSVLLGLWGVFLLVAGFTVAGAWTMLVAWFIMQTAQSQYIAETEIEPLGLLRCGDVADPAGDPLAPDTPCDAALDLMEATRRRAVPVASGTTVLGLVSLSDFAKAAPQNGTCTVTSIMTPVAQLAHVDADTNALDAMKQLSSSGFHQLPVMNPAGELFGFVSIETIRRAVAFDLERARLGARVDSHRGSRV